MMCRQVFTV